MHIGAERTINNFREMVERLLQKSKSKRIEALAKVIAAILEIAG